MRNFFKYVTDLPEGSGFEMFGLCHMIWLILIAAFSINFANLYKNAVITGNHSYKDKGTSLNKSVSRILDRKKIRLIIGFIMPAISIYRDTVLIVTGHFDKYYLPLHLCAMALWIGALYCFTSWRFVGVIYVSLCVPGAISALIFPDWVDYPLWNYMHIHDFISHGLIVAWGICLIVSGEVVPGFKDLWITIVFGLVGIALIMPVNRALGTNYWFLNIPSPGSPLVEIMNITGEKWYVPGYILFVLCVVVIWIAIINGIKYLEGNGKQC